jgi:hypothetical protein
MKDQRKFDGVGLKGKDNLTSLLSYCKAKGLCYKCGDKWGKGHTYPAQVPLHIVEELKSAMQHETLQLALTEDSDSEEGLELMEAHEARE